VALVDCEARTAATAHAGAAVGQEAAQMNPKSNCTDTFYVPNVLLKTLFYELTIIPLLKNKNHKYD
jgi:hypothetical protein